LQATATVRFQQLSAPLCAKAVEDTAFYRYGRHIDRNDVGFDAYHFAYSPAEFHRRMQARATALPHSMLATATHDHKRGEDVRARLAVLSELPDEWARSVETWIERSASQRRTTADMPTAGDLTILFQTVVGAWPLGLSAGDRAGVSAYEKRIQEWQLKALREAKLHSDWSAPNAAYEKAASTYIAWLFENASGLLAEIENFASRISPAGAANGLAQTLIKLTAPGVPDIYQGTEFWDFSLVDPDNRAPVEFASRERALEETSQVNHSLDWANGHIKQRIIARTLAVRKEKPRLFSDGAYVPLEIAGKHADHIVAFARVLDSDLAITAVLRLPFYLLVDDNSLSVTSQWDDTRIVLPTELGDMRLLSLLQCSEHVVSKNHLQAGAIFSALPVALLIKQAERWN
jgi:(1->4)-alpha-D-glucan 1-alpha-D-glucosylmutase